MRAETPRNVRLVEVIQTESGRGKGIEGDIFRLVKQYWSKDGKLLAEHDPYMNVGKIK